MNKIIVLLILCFAFVGCSSDSTGQSTNPQLDSQTNPAPKLSETEQDAYDELLTTEQFAGTRVGFGGTISHQAIAFTEILGSEHASDLFADLQEDATLAGQLYGLCGLYVTDKEHFDEVISEYHNSPNTVQTFFGCILGDSPLTELIPTIEDGSLPEAFKNCNE